MGDVPGDKLAIPDATAAGTIELATKRNRLWSAAEIGAIVVLFFVCAGRHAPDVNEAHYLAKAKHYWNPDWCAGDTFLESNDAHLVFYWTTGWLTKWMSLASVAWIGRLLTWSLLAISWHRFVSCLVPKRGYGLFSAAMAVCLWEQFHLAGEWVVGGFEAKGFALALLFVALRCVAQKRWATAFIWLGATSAFHVLVGGWGVVALTVTLFARWRSDQPNLGRVAMGVIIGGLLALPGLGPAIWLMMGVDASTKQQAAEIYVRRLAHHLEFYRMEPARISLFGILLAVWVLAWVLAVIRHDMRPTLQRIQWFVLASVGVAFVGVGLDYFSILLPVVHRLLRFYWFRLADVMVPMGVVLLAVDWLGRGQHDITKGILLVLVCCTLTYGFWMSPRRYSPSFVQGLGRDLESAELEKRWQDWRDVCRWIDGETPATASCLTPTISQTFCWYANRAEVAVWKNIPQDAQSIIAWDQTLEDIRQSGIYPRPNEVSPKPVIDPTELAEKHDFQYLIAMNRPTILWPQAYRNASFIIYRNPQAMTDTTENTSRQIDRQP